MNRKFCSNETRVLVIGIRSERLLTTATAPSYASVLVDRAQIPTPFEYGSFHGLKVGVGSRHSKDNQHGR
ncbi:hypothetical protein FHT77_005489 [Rhizobium sp. BK181]|nr:hypothetical protein [Rhizobium sp. BK181]MCS3744415.1 hypothetical protein [Rhizobium sp. BK661]